MLKNRIKFTALTLVFAFLLSSCSTKKTGQEWNSYNENSEWSYFMPKDVDRDMVPFIFPGKYVVDIENGCFRQADVSDVGIGICPAFCLPQA